MFRKSLDVIFNFQYMKLYSLNYEWYWNSYHVVSDSREEALKIIQWYAQFISDVGNNDIDIYDSYSEARDSGKYFYWYYWEERDIDEVLVTERS